MLATVEESGRQYFLNHLFKSSLFGTFNEVFDADIGYKFNRLLAYGMSGLLLVLFCYFVISLIYLSYRRELFRLDFVVLLSGGCFLFFALVKFRYDIPAPHHSDFRLIYPVLPIIFCVFAVAWVRFLLSYLGGKGVKGVKGVKGGKDGKFRPRWVILISAIFLSPFLLFILMSVAFSLPLASLSARLFDDKILLSLDASSIVRSGASDVGGRWDAPGNHVYVNNQYVKVDLTSFIDDGSRRALEVSVDHNEHYVIIVKSKYDSRAFLIEPHVGSGHVGMALHRVYLDPNHLLRGPLEWIIVYPALYERNLGLVSRWDPKFYKEISWNEFVGDDKYSLGHLRLLPLKPNGSP
jgi:hypothetical protein